MSIKQTLPPPFPNPDTYPVLKGQYQAGWNNNQNYTRKYMAFFHFISSFEGTYEIYKIQLPFLLFLLILHQLTSAIIIFYKFLTLYLLHLKKCFRHTFSFVIRFTLTPTLLTAKVCQEWQKFFVNTPLWRRQKSYKT